MQELVFQAAPPQAAGAGGQLAFVLRLLDPPQQRAMAALSVFPAAFTDEAAAAVTGVGSEHMRVRAMLNGLYRSGAVQYNAARQEWLLHMAIREASAHLDPDEASSAEMRYIVYYTNMLQMVGEMYYKPYEWQTALSMSRTSATDIVHMARRAGTTKAGAAMLGDAMRPGTVSVLTAADVWRTFEEQRLGAAETLMGSASQPAAAAAALPPVLARGSQGSHAPSSTVTPQQEHASSRSSGQLQKKRAQAAAAAGAGAGMCSDPAAAAEPDVCMHGVPDQATEAEAAAGDEANARAGCAGGGQFPLLCGGVQRRQLRLDVRRRRRHACPAGVHLAACMQAGIRLAARACCHQSARTYRPNRSSSCRCSRGGAVRGSAAAAAAISGRGWCGSSLRLSRHAPNRSCAHASQQQQQQQHR